MRHDGGVASGVVRVAPAAQSSAQTGPRRSARRRTRAPCGRPAGARGPGGARPPLAGRGVRLASSAVGDRCKPAGTLGSTPRARRSHDAAPARSPSILPGTAARAAHPRARARAGNRCPAAGEKKKKRAESALGSVVRATVCPRRDLSLLLRFKEALGVRLHLARRRPFPSPDVGAALRSARPPLPSPPPLPPPAATSRGLGFASPARECASRGLGAFGSVSAPRHPRSLPARRSMAGGSAPQLADSTRAASLASFPPRRAPGACAPRVPAGAPSGLWSRLGAPRALARAPSGPGAALRRPPARFGSARVRATPPGEMASSEPALWALDFDGVLCDSVAELAEAALRTAEGLWPDEFGAPEAKAARPDILEGLYKVRPVMETGYVRVRVGMQPCARLGAGDGRGTGFARGAARATGGERALRGGRGGRRAGERALRGGRRGRRALRRGRGGGPAPSGPC